MRFRFFYARGASHRKPLFTLYVKGFEPSTYWSVASRSIQLSYTYTLFSQHK